jgi:hypothetical protein
MRLREPFYLASLLWAALLILPAHTARAAETDLDSKAGALDRGVTTREQRSAIFAKFGVPNTALYTALPPGQALILFSLCGNDTACQTRALNDRNAHMGWGKVVEDLKKNGFTTADKAGEAVRRVTDAHRDLAAKDETDKAEQPVKKTEKVEKMEKPERIGRVDRPERPERPGR